MCALSASHSGSPTLPSASDALLAMLGHLPADNAWVLGQSGPDFSPTESAALTAWRLQQAFLSVQAVAPVWSALLQQPDAITRLLAAFDGHPWQPLVAAVLQRWQRVIGSDAESLPDLALVLQVWQQAHDEAWAELDVPPLLLVPFVVGALPSAPVPPAWQSVLQTWAQHAGKLAAQVLALPLAAAPGTRTVAAQQAGSVLYRYAANGATQQTVLLVYAWINSCDVLDLSPSQSLIAALQAQGIEVWLLDWRDAGSGACTLTQYVDQHLAWAVATVRAASGGPVSVVGICQGGTLALCYAARHPGALASLSLLAAPVSFQQPDDRLSRWTRRGALAASLPAWRAGASHSPAALTLLFLQLKSFKLRLGKYLALLNAPPDDMALQAFVRMEHWLMAGPLLSGPGIAEYAEQCYGADALQRNALQIGATTVRLSDIRVPVQMLVAEHDHIVPPSASLALQQRLPQLSVDMLPTGHIGLLVGKARLVVAERIATFLASNK